MKALHMASDPDGYSGETERRKGFIAWTSSGERIPEHAYARAQNSTPCARDPGVHVSREEFTSRSSLLSELLMNLIIGRTHGMDPAPQGTDNRDHHRT